MSNCICIKGNSNSDDQIIYVTEKCVELVTLYQNSSDSKELELQIKPPLEEFCHIEQIPNSNSIMIHRFKDKIGTNKFSIYNYFPESQ